MVNTGIGPINIFPSTVIVIPPQVIACSHSKVLPVKYYSLYIISIHQWQLDMVPLLTALVMRNQGVAKVKSSYFRDNSLTV